MRPLPLAALLVAGLLACSASPAPQDGGGSATGASRETRPTQRIEERVPVTLPDGTVVSAEIADDPREIRIGMMGRQEVPEGEGMLFVFPEPGHRSFWMKNCLVSLDIVWLAGTPEGGRVIHVEASAPPCEKDPCPSYMPGRRAHYVLELGAGRAARHGVVRGSVVTFEPPPKP